ncbi:MAG: UDP-N-acetylglucosamine 1-carboxyvinyltransferase [Parcubacteria group bacterium GW2011_GWA2_38_13]|nr:MAG: UDP-N-acetylglucosamine 1-carboxyvinyltransferase [Parcubacteria group bacterium GW2011_GWA2_38_13]
MASYIITGGKTLHGVAETKTAKNSALACMCASLLTNEPVTLKEIPRIEDVNDLEAVLKSIGVNIRWSGNDMTLIAPKKINLKEINSQTASKIRVILLFIGALANRLKNFSLPRAGGCKLGKRTITPHLFGLEKLGMKISCDPTAYKIKKPHGLHGTKIVMYESGDTSTENVIMAAVLARGRTVIKLASANYMVQDLCYLLNAMGAKISNIGLTTLIIDGVEKLHGALHYIVPDPIESMFWISLAATTNSSLLIKGCPEEFLELELLKLEKMGFKYSVVKKYKSKSGFFNLVDIKTRPSKLIALDDKIDARPFPGLNIDNLPFFVPIASQAKGTTMIHDWCYENRSIYYMEFQKLGAMVRLADPHRVFIEGPTQLKANQVMSPPALRPATILVIGMLAATGKSTLYNTYSIDRGYENLYGRLKKLGADIKEVK